MCSAISGTPRGYSCEGIGSPDMRDGCEGIGSPDMRDGREGVGPPGYGDTVPPSVPKRTRSRSLETAAVWKPPTRARVLRIRDRLRQVYGIPRMAPHGRPLDELILTVLSQSTNDRNRDVAFLRLRERFGDLDPPTPPPRPIDYEAVLAAPVSEVEEAIRPGGISKVKSARIQAILAAIANSSAGTDAFAEDRLSVRDRRSLVA